MKKYVKKVSKKNKTPPGSIIHIGDVKRDDVKITVFKYNNEKVEKKDLNMKGFETFYIDSSFNYWIVIDGLHRPEVMRSIRKKFDVNNIIIENIVNTSLRPSIEKYKNCTFIVTKEIGLNKEREIDFEQISLIFSNNVLITFTENKLDSYEVISKMIEGRSFREKGVAYLCYTILDFIVDNYFVFMEYIDEQIETIEDNIFTNNETIDLEMIYKIKKDLLLIQKSIWPQREIINMIIKEEEFIFDVNYEKYYRDVIEHIYQLKDMIDVFKEAISGILNIYLTKKSNKMNEIMKFLTIISTIFMPLSFIAGLYGMNFKYMPELGMKYSYFFVLIVMAMIFISMVVYIKSKKWF